jgi:sugar phosphate isomerase/epimerase
MIGEPIQAEQLGVQLHCLRHAVRESLPHTLEVIRNLGFEAVELVSFPGCRANPWGDFGTAADLPPRSIRAALKTAGLHCPSVMVNALELGPARIDGVLDWIAGVGARKVALTAFSLPTSATVPDWQDALASVNAHAERCRERGLQFVLHTQPELWRPVEGRIPIEFLPALLDASLVELEYDPSGAVMHRADPLRLFDDWRGTFHAVHLRDARAPLEPVPYLPALPLGCGAIAWDDFLRASRRVAVGWYFLEMEVADSTQTFDALECSLAHLASLGVDVPTRAGSQRFSTLAGTA